MPEQQAPNNGMSDERINLELKLEALRLTNSYLEKAKALFAWLKESEVKPPKVLM